MFEKIRFQFLEKVKVGYFIVSVLIGIYGLMCAFSPGTWRFLDGVNFLFHEAGHFFLRPFGIFIHFLGGTLGQLFFPVVLIVYFRLKGQIYSSFVMMFWLAQNLFNISVYAGDAVATRLPILMGGTHDWNWMLTRLSWLRYTGLISRLIYLSGFFILLMSIVGMLRYSMRDKNTDDFEYYEDVY